jgi:peptide/bleomycin uptake transporter
MFVSFFPSPRLFFWSAAGWTLFAVLVWFFGANDLGQFIGLANPADGTPPIIGVSVFWSPPFLWFYIYFAIVVAIFAGFWKNYAPHPWFWWSVLGTALIVFTTYFQVEVSVAINKWYGPFYDLIQKALATPNSVTLGEFYGHLLSFAGIAFVAVLVAVATRFFVNHYVFRWRTAMNDYYLANWNKLRPIEGASQRVQDDTMRFARTTEDLGVDMINSVMTIIAFLPILHELEVNVVGIPLLGAIPYPLVTVSIIWSLFGTGFMSLIGIKLPGLNFKNQRVEAAFRKELVIGEDDPNRAQPVTLNELFHNLRKNYFTMYFHYIYFNVGRVSFLQTDNIFPYIILAPTIVAGKITLGVMERILGAFGRVRESFQFLVNSWTTIIELISIYRRLRTFESAIHGTPITPKDEYLVDAAPAD